MKKRLQAFAYAFSGFYEAAKSETHLKIHIVASFCVMAMGVYFSLTTAEWFAIGICIALVISFELINSAIEKLCDVYSEEENTKIKYIKDVSAAAVLVVAIFSAVVGVVVFVPYVSKLV
jgi:diacylglycerol kinase